ncbi:MAG TPA: CvpA family protein, partial [Alphaproteobacteria bacterium]|nr:CvpA family protein [Alphaproteobacteria bacterium]
IFLAFTQYHRITPFLEDKIPNAMLRDFVGGLAIFAAVMIILLPIGFYLRGFVKGEQVTAIDRSLGFVFGAARGYLLMCIFYLIVAWLVPEEKQPVWLKEANTRPALVYGAELIRKTIPAEQLAIIEKKKRENEEKEKKEGKADEAAVPAPSSAPPSLDGKVNQLDHVIQPQPQTP